MLLWDGLEPATTETRAKQLKTKLVNHWATGDYVYDTSIMKNSIYTSAGRSFGFSVSMFVSDICNQTSNISDYGVEV